MANSKPVEINGVRYASQKEAVLDALKLGFKDYEEIAKRVGCSVAIVKQVKKRALGEPVVKKIKPKVSASPSGLSDAVTYAIKQGVVASINMQTGEVVFK